MGAGKRDAASDASASDSRLSAQALREAFEQAQRGATPLVSAAAGALGLFDLKTAQAEASSNPNAAPSGAGTDASYTNLMPFRDSRYYDPRDLAVLQDFIDANGLTEASSANDLDNGDGKLDPLEVGYQVWCGGRLRELRTGPNQYGSYGYGISTVPDSVAKLDTLESLDMSGNRLTQLPVTLSALERLRVLRLNNNQLDEFPDATRAMGNLQELVLTQNQIREVPSDIQYMRKLQELHVENNPLSSTPEAVMQQRLDQGFDRGLRAQQGPILRSAGDCQPMG